jgi:hypothetical protein
MAYREADAEDELITERAMIHPAAMFRFCSLNKRTQGRWGVSSSTRTPPSAFRERHCGAQYPGSG